MEWEKIFANHISDKGLISKIYKALLNSRANKQTNKKKLRKTQPKTNKQKTPIQFKMGKGKRGVPRLTQSAKHPTLDFSLGCNLRDVGLSPALGSALSVACA